MVLPPCSSADVYKRQHQDIRARFAGKYQYQTGSDCEVILSLYREMRADSDFDS